MRFNLGPPPRDDTILEEGGDWHDVNEPSPMRAQITGLVAALLITACIFLVIFITNGPEPIARMSMPMLFLLIIPIIPIHELIHAISFEGGIASSRATLGFYPKAFGFYAHYNGKITRYRYVVIAALPFVILTGIPLLAVILFQIKDKYLIELAMANGMMSAMDVLTIIIVLRQVPRQAILVNVGLKAYWKPADNI